jgi:hypothetical protein
MAIAALLDELPKPVCIALMILGFIAWWPIGLVVLALLIGSGRMGCWNHRGGGRWQGKMERMQAKMDRMRSRMDGFRGSCDWGSNPPSSGNRAFDEYRSDTIKRLEQEQREFRDFLDRLRFAKDKTEFDQFMAERRSPSNDAGSQAPAQN